MSIIGDGIVLGAGGESASIFATGLAETDTVTATKDGKTIAGKLVSKPNPEYCGLPDGYTQLEYIDTTGTQFVDIGRIPITSKTGFNIKMAVLDTTGANCFGGCVLGGSTFSYLSLRSNKVGFYPNPNLAVSFGEYTAGQVDEYEYKYNSGGIATYSKNRTILGTTTEIVSSNSSWALFSFKDSNGVIRNTTAETAKVRFIRQTVFDVNVVIADLFPVKRNSDGVVGIYDVINNVFCANAGTGTFTAGAETPPYIYGFDIAPIKSYGTWTVSNADSTKVTDVLVDAAAEFEVTL